MLIVATLLALVLLESLDTLYPLPLPTDSGTATVVLARDGAPLRAFADANGVWRYPVRLDEVSPLYLQALIHYEDRWFHLHRGVNPLALLRAAGQALWHRRPVSGGSTLSMQVARLLDPVPRSLGGKLRQVLRAAQLEWQLDKRQILTLYLERAPFGGTIEGVQAASYAYLGKPAARLSHAEAALLAVLPQAPSRLRPDRAPQRAQAARDKVLARLSRDRVWSAEQVGQARMESVVARQLRPPAYAALLAERARREQPDTPRIETTIDLELQRRAEERIAAWMRRLPPGTSVALLIVETRSAQVRAYVGSTRYGDADSAGHVDMVAAFRSPGSTLKPFLYGMALDDGLIHSASLLVDAPQSFAGYRPGNFDQRYRGPVSATEALQQSLNVPAVALLQRLGPERFAARMKHAGVPLRLPHGTRPNLSMILGGTEARLEDLVAAFSALHRDGLATAPQFVRDATPDQRRLLSPGAAWIVRRMLESAPRPGETHGRFEQSERAALAWKTGTSYGFRDSWAIGATAGATVGVWIGRPDGTPLPGQYGAVTALPLLLSVVDTLPRELRAPPAPMPDSVAMQNVCWPLGRRAADTRKDACHRRLDAWTVDGSVPPTLATAGDRLFPIELSYRREPVSGLRIGEHCSQPHEVETARVTPWPNLAQPWLSGAERRRAMLPPLAPDCADTANPSAQLLITGLVDGSVLQRPPGAAHAPRVRLRALGTAERVRWLANGRLIGESRGGTPLLAEFDQAGPQRVVAIDDRGRFGSVEIDVVLPEPVPATDSSS